MINVDRDKPPATRYRCGQLICFDEASVILTGQREGVTPVIKGACPQHSAKLMREIMDQGLRVSLEPAAPRTE